MFSDDFDRVAYAKRLQEKLKTLRAVSGLSQQDVAGKLGIVRSTYVNYENGTKELSWEKSLLFCFFFKSIPQCRELMEVYRLLPGQIGAFLPQEDGELHEA